MSYDKKIIRYFNKCKKKKNQVKIDFEYNSGHFAYYSYIYIFFKKGKVIEFGGIDF